MKSVCVGVGSSIVPSHRAICVAGTPCGVRVVCVCAHLLGMHALLCSWLVVELREPGLFGDGN